jgi:hypothetical protein
LTVAGTLPKGSETMVWGKLMGGEVGLDCYVDALDALV